MRLFAKIEAGWKWSKMHAVLLFCCGDKCTWQKSMHPKLIEIYEHKHINQINI
jgi:hypothetical protein